MDANNWRASHGQVQMPGEVMGGEAVAATGMEGADWKGQLHQESRQRIVNKIMETLKRHLPYSGPEGQQELNKIAVRFEEKIYFSATNQADYLRKISMKMLTMETKSQNPMANSLQPGSGNSSQEPGSQSMQSQMQNQVQQLPLPMVSNQNPLQQQLIPHNMHNNMASSALPTMSNVPAQNANIQNIQSLNNIASIGNSMGQGMPQNAFANSQRQIQGRQQPIASQEQPQQSQGSNHYMYNQQLFMNQKFQQGGISQQSMVQSQLSQRQQQNLLQTNQIQSSQQPVMQSSLRQTASSSSSSSTLQNQQSTLQLPTQTLLHQQSVRRQQHSMLSSQQQQQQQQHHNAQQQNASNQLLAMQNTGVDAQQQQRMMSQQNSMSNMQQQQSVGQQSNLQSLHQQQPAAQQNSHPIMHQQQLGSQTNSSGFQQQEMVGVQHGNSSLQSNQQASLLQQSVVSVQQQMQASMPNMLPNQSQQPQSMQHQVMTQIPAQPILQQGNTLSREVQQMIQTSGPSLHQQSTIDQKQILQSQRVKSESQLTSLDSSSQMGNASGGDWQEEVYQKFKYMHDMYYPEINETYQRVAAKLQQHDSVPQMQKSEQHTRLNLFKVMLERVLLTLRLTKNEIQLYHKEKILEIEKQIITILNSTWFRKPVSLSQKGQLAHPQSTQMHVNEGQINPQMQSVNVQGSGVNTQQNNLSNLQHSVSSVSNPRRSMMDVLQPSSNIDAGQGNALNQMQQAAMNSLQQNLSGTQQMIATSMASQTGLTTLTSSANPFQANSNMLPGQQIKQEPQMFSNQQLKQQYQRQMQFAHRQQILQQQLQSQQQPSQMPAQQMTQHNQINDVNDVKLKYQIGGKTGILSSSQRSAYHHPSSSISSQQVLQVPSPQIGHHSSPQIEQQNLLASHTKVGTPLQSANSPFVVPSPSTSVAPSPMPSESEKIVSGVTSLPNVGNSINPSASAVSIPNQSLAIGTPGISASPLLAEFTNPDGVHGVSSNIVSGASNVVERPLDRLIKAAKSLSPKALSASVNDISSVISLTDRIAGSAPGNGSRAAIGKDLAAMTKCHLEAKNFFSQDGPGGTKKMRRCITAIASNVVSSTESVNECLSHAPDTESDGQYTGMPGMKRPRTEANHVLEEELREINLRLIDTVVDISDDIDPTAIAAAAAEFAEGTLVKCSFSAVGLSSSLKLQFASAQMSPIQPLRLLIPKNYPSCSPILLDKFPVEVSKDYEDLSMKAKSRFSISLRTLAQPMSLGDIARTWDRCARAVLSEYAQLSGGGTFSSKYGTWEKCLSAA